jgi:hypothetical protein
MKYKVSEMSLMYFLLAVASVGFFLILWFYSCTHSYKNDKELIDQNDSIGGHINIITGRFCLGRLRFDLWPSITINYLLSMHSPLIRKFGNTYRPGLG